jgi:glycosyltransferase involved in cell wall biosynthesis
MIEVVYYLPNVPSVQRTTRYNHALAVADQPSHSTLITYPTRPPAEIATAHDDVVVLSSANPLRRAREASRVAEACLDADGVFLTTFHYAPALAGFLADRRWVIDVYDDPIQYVYNRPRSLHELSARGLSLLLGRADRAVHTVHPSTPRVYTENPRFAVNGAPTTLFPSPEPSSTGEKLRAVCASSHDKGLETTLRGIDQSGVSTHVDVFGAENPSFDVPDRGGLDAQFHGHQPHERVIETLGNADLGFCVLPNRPDWRYAHPIRIGEYLASGTVPVGSDFPGIRELARDAGVYVSPDADSVATALQGLWYSDIAERKERAMERAKRIPWTEERDWFAQQVLEQSPS